MPLTEVPPNSCRLALDLYCRRCEYYRAYICFMRQPIVEYMRPSLESLNFCNDLHSKAKAGTVDYHYPVRDPDDVLSSG